MKTDCTRNLKEHVYQVECIDGIPKVYWYNEESDFNILVMQLLGPSLEDLFCYCKRMFGLKTVLMIFFQLVLFLFIIS